MNRDQVTALAGFLSRRGRRCGTCGDTSAQAVMPDPRRPGELICSDCCLRFLLAGEDLECGARGRALQEEDALRPGEDDGDDTPYCSDCLAEYLRMFARGAGMRLEADTDDREVRAARRRPLNISSALLLCDVYSGGPATHKIGSRDTATDRCYGLRALCWLMRLQGPPCKGDDSPLPRALLRTLTRPPALMTEIIAHNSRR